MLEIRLVGFPMKDLEELQQLVSDALDALGLKAAGFIVFDPSITRLCLDQKPYPHVVVCSDEVKRLNTAALQINETLGVMVKKEFCQEVLLPLPIDNWSNRGR